MSDPPNADRRAAPVLATLTAKRAAGPALAWGALFGLLIANEALGYRSAFPSEASREQFVTGFGHSGGLTAVTGPARALDTVGGAVAWRVFGLMLAIGAIWGLLAATRHLRGEEDSGRWELFLAGRTDRRRATMQTLTGLGAAWLVLWAAAAFGAVVAGRSPAVDVPVTAALFYAVAGTAPAAMFLGVGALMSQMASTRRQANALGAAVFAVAYLVKMVADARLGLAWLRWATPFGWTENLRPLTGSQPLALVPIVVLIGAAAIGAAAIAGRRDAGAGAVVRSGDVPSKTALLSTTEGLLLRLERGVVIGWIAGLAGLGALFGIVARSASESGMGDRAVAETVGRLGGAGSVAASWIGYEFVYIAAVLSFAAVGQVVAARDEEAEGRLDLLLARPVRRARWMGGRLSFAVVFVVVAGLAAGVGGWAAIAGRGDLGLVDMLLAGLNIAVPGVFVVGIGMLLLALAPRLAAPLLYVVVLWSFLVAIIGTSITTNHWVLDTALLSHLGPVPAADVDWTAIAWLAGLAAAAALAAIGAFRRRDLAAA